MIKLLISFIVVFGLFFFGIRAVRGMTGKQQLDFTKLAGYSIICAVLTISALVAIVVLF
jgi:hypothetical protein